MQAQPYRAGKGREPGAALTAMLKGRTAGGHNPQDIVRRTQVLMRASKKRTGRPARPKRPPRPPR